MPWFIGKLNYLKQPCQQPKIDLDWLEAQKFVVWCQARRVKTQLFVRDEADLDIVNSKISDQIVKQGILPGDVVAIYFTYSNGRLHPESIKKIT